jgi:hypothetical protein
MPYRSAVSHSSISDPAADRKGATRIGQYRVGKQALYVPFFPMDQYIPFSAIRRAWSQSAQLGVIGCCGKTVPVVRVRVQYDSGDAATGLVIQNYTLDTQAEADRMLALLAAGCPGLVLTSPFKTVED